MVDIVDRLLKEGVSTLAKDEHDSCAGANWPSAEMVEQLRGRGVRRRS